MGRQQASIQAMSEDAGSRFSLDPKRLYTAGMSGAACCAPGLPERARSRSRSIERSSTGCARRISRSIEAQQFRGIDLRHTVDLRGREPFAPERREECLKPVGVQRISRLAQIARENAVLGAYGANRGCVLVDFEGFA